VQGDQEQAQARRLRTAREAEIVIRRARRGTRAASCAAAALVCACVTATAQAHLFARPAFYPTQGSPVALAAADLNHDGITDLVVSEHFPSAVEVLLGRGGGTLGPARSLGSVVSPGGIAIADVLGSGHPDVIVADKGAADVVVFPGHGDGTFGTPVRVPLPNGPNGAAVPVAVAAGNLNADGIPDIAVADSANEQVDVLLADGHGGFAPAAKLPLGDSPYDFPQAIAIAPLTHGGHLDIVTANVSNGITAQQGMGTVSVLLGHGDGSFGAPVTTSIGGGPSALAVADLNRDGNLDLAVAEEDRIVPLLGTGGGTFTAQPPIDQQPGLFPDVAVADFTGDGIPDIASSNSASLGAGGPTIYPGNGNGSFGPPLQSPFASDPNLPLGGALAAADFKGDGRLDLATGASQSNASGGQSNGVAILLNTAGLQAPTPTLAPAHTLGCYLFKTSRRGRGVATVSLTGRHFFPGDHVSATITGNNSLAVDNGTVGADGSVALMLRGYVGSPNAERATDRQITVTDDGDPSLHASVTLLTGFVFATSTDTSLAINPRRKVTFGFSGFPAGATVYEHYILNGRIRKTARLGRVRGACGTLTATIHHWPIRKPARGEWRLQFDNHHKYSARTFNRFVFRYAVLPAF
jgi:FG-GAP-like repeat